MKRFFSLLLILTIIVLSLSFTACGSSETNAKLTIKESLNDNYDTLVQKFETSEDFGQFSKYLSGWAKKVGLQVKTSSDQYIILSKSATSGFEKAESFTLHSDVVLDKNKEDERDRSFQTAAAVMTALYSADYHGALSGIFTLQSSDGTSGAGALSNKYLNSDNFLSLTYSGDTMICNNLAASCDLLASQKIHMTSPQYTKAFRITLKGTPDKSPFKGRSDHPNGIKTIGDLLASCQSAGVLFELASFSGGSSPDLYPTKTTAVIVLQENDVESFTSRFEKSYERIEEYYEDIEEPFTYKMKEVNLPKQVISVRDTDNIVSLMYTIINGTYLRSESGNIMAASNIGRISTKNGLFRMEINARSLEQNLMDEMLSVFETTCGLCDVKYREIHSTPLWYASGQIPLIAHLLDRLEVTPSGQMENISASAFLEKKPDLNLVIWGLSLDDAERDISVLLDYMGSFSQNTNQTESSRD